MAAAAAIGLGTGVSAHRHAGRLLPVGTQQLRDLLLGTVAVEVLAALRGVAHLHAHGVVQLQQPLQFPAQGAQGGPAARQVGVDLQHLRAFGGRRVRSDAQARGLSDAGHQRQVPTSRCVCRRASTGTM